MAKPQWTDQQVFDQMNSGTKWSTPVISYTFPLDASQLHFQQGEGAGFSPLNAPSKHS